MKVSEYCTQAGITVEQYRKYSYEFLQCEGYDDDGTEYETLGEYIKAKKRPEVPAWVSSREPWQKGDFEYGLS